MSFAGGSSCKFVIQANGPQVFLKLDDGVAWMSVEMSPAVARGIRAMLTNAIVIAELAAKIDAEVARG